MNLVFADTVFFVALTNVHDQFHAQATAHSRNSRCTLWTTSWVIVEFANFMSPPSRRPIFRTVVESLESDPQVRLIEPTQELFRSGLDLFHARPDKEWSLTDCISFVVMEREGISEALTGDHHFEQAGFVALLK